MPLNAPSKDIGDLLAGAGIGQWAATTGWAIHASREPAFQAGVVPHTVITIYDTGGFEPLYSTPIEHPTVQVRIRGATNGYLAAYDKAQQIRAAITGLNGQVINGVTYTGWIMGDITFLEYDDQSRPILVINFRLMRSQ